MRMQRTAMRSWGLLVCVVLIGACAKHRKATEVEDGLADGVAGRACKRDADCPGGRCSAVLHIVSLDDGVAAPGGYCTASCESDSDCGAEGICSVPAGELEGECLVRCTAADACREGYLCTGLVQLGAARVAGTCRPKPETEQLDDGAAGRACKSNAECGGGQCMGVSPLGVTLPGNYCSARCLEDAQCGEGGACLAFEGSSSAGHCFARCTDDRDCARDGYRCRTLAPGFQGCFPAPAALPDRRAGAACSVDADCGGSAGSCVDSLPFGSFVADETTPQPGGYCTQECALDADCGAGAQCISRGIQGGMCLGSCTDQRDCRAGYRCVAHGRELDDSQRVCIALPQ